MEKICSILSPPPPLLLLLINVEKYVFPLNIPLSNLPSVSAPLDRHSYFVCIVYASQSYCLLGYVIFAQNHGLQLYGEEEERNTRMNVRVTDARRLVISLKTVVSQDLRSLDSPAGLTSLPLLNFETIFVKRALINDRIILLEHSKAQLTYSISFLTSSSFLFVSYFIRALIIEREIFQDSSRKLISRRLHLPQLEIYTAY